MGVPAVNDPPVGLHEDGGAQVSVAIPPVAGAGGAAAGTQDALVQPVQLGSVPDTLEELLVSVLHTALVIPLQPGLDTPNQHRSVLPHFCTGTDLYCS